MEQSSVLANASAKKISEIGVQEVVQGKNWVVEKVGWLFQKKDPLVRESLSFSHQQFAVFSSAAKLHDGSSLPALVVKSFPDQGLHLETFLRAEKM